MRVMVRRRISIGAACLLLTGAASGAADCPPAGALEELASLPLAEGFRTLAMELEPPTGLYREAVAAPGRVAVDRDGKLGQAVVLANMPLEAIWRALNDDDHHAEVGSIPVRVSRVIAGQPGGGGRTTFQYFKKAGVGRWWVNRLEMNGELFRRSGRRLWELSWHDVLEEYPGDEPPVAIDHDVRKLEHSLGAWLLVRLGEKCTLVEYTTRGEPGGVIGALQFLVATRTLRDNVEGMLEMARGHFDEPHDAIRFVRPDGSPLDGAAAE